ncbi:kinase-like protein, partial [Ramaria rubella]
REVRVWKELDHESIAEFYGVVSDSNNTPAIISPWYDRGSVNIYLKDNPQAVPMKSLWEIVLGVEYLHENNVVHGDLKGGNVMVDSKGHAKLIDFGLSRLIDSVAGPGLTTSSVSFSIRWCAPELVQSDDSPTTKASDVYAFASTALELLTGEVPYQGLKERAVIMAVTKGVTPRRPENNVGSRGHSCSEEFWSVLESCWKVAPLRPSISEVRGRMRTLSL